MSDREAVFEPVRQLFGLVWNQGRLELIDRLVTAGVVLHAGRNAVHGRDNLKTIIADFLIGFPDVQHNIEDLVIEGDRVVTRWRGIGPSSRRLCRHRAHRPRDRLHRHHHLPHR